MDIKEYQKITFLGYTLAKKKVCKEFMKKWKTVLKKLYKVSQMFIIQYTWLSWS